MKCRDAEKEFQERCRKFLLRPNSIEYLGTDIFSDWWEEYTHDFFGTSIEEVVNKIFGDRPKKPSAPQSKEAPQGGRVLKQVDVVVPAVVKKKLALSSNKTKTTAQNLSSKRLQPVTETTGETPRPPKRVKKLAKNGPWKIHVISSHTTRTIAHSASPSALVAQASTDNRPFSASPATQAQPTPEVPEVVVEPVVAPSVDLLAAPRST
ncbi:hypothetical protein EV2_030142 [Malus domestica]